jgi:NAD(P)-dependent dehydrogenase (short-subunit alcohol dehydrogenase family)
MTIKRKSAVVTGGAHPSGIGFASAQRLVRYGYDVIVTGVSAVEVALTPPSDHIRSVVLDVRDESALIALMSGLDRLDALVNCAGLSSPNEYDSSDFSRTLDINVTGTMRACVAARQLLAQTHGAIVNIASIYATFGSSAVPAYSASKGAIVQLTKSLAAAWGSEGIRVNAIAPGWIKTALSAPLFENEQHVASLSARTPLGRLGVSEDCGDVIAFLCTDEARYVTGATIPVDGGYIITG